MESLPIPTMKMIKAQFCIPVYDERCGNSGKDSRSKEEQPMIKKQTSRLFHEAKSELEKHRTNQFNQLGKRISIRIQNLLKQLDGSVDDT